MSNIITPAEECNQSETNTIKKVYPPVSEWSRRLTFNCHARQLGKLMRWLGETENHNAKDKRYIIEEWYELENEKRYINQYEGQANIDSQTMHNMFDKYDRMYTLDEKKKYFTLIYHTYTYIGEDHAACYPYIRNTFLKKAFELSQAVSDDSQKQMDEDIKKFMNKVVKSLYFVPLREQITLKEDPYPESDAYTKYYFGDYMFDGDKAFVDIKEWYNVKAETYCGPITFEMMVLGCLC